MTCKVCGKEQHYCDSCGYDDYKIDGFCDEKCFKNSDEYKTYHSKLIKFWNSLDEVQRSDLWSLWDNGILLDDKWEFIIDDIFTDERE